MQLTDILPKEGWAKLEREVHDRFHLRVHAYDTEGATFTGETLWGNPLCPALRKSSTAISTICSVVNQTMRHDVANGSAASNECDAGMLVTCTPVVVNGETLGMVGACGAFLGPEACAESFLIEKTAGIDEETVEKMSESVPRFTPEQAQEVTDYLTARVAEIVNTYQAAKA
jgi:Predicted histidine kinase sensor domain.